MALTDTPIATYDNFVIENKITDIVNSTLDVNPLMTVDTTLTTAAGLKKTIHKYTYEGAVEKLEKGAKNTTKGKVKAVPVDYTVERYQQTYVYNDMDVMNDPFIVDVLSDGAAKTMANEIRTEYFTEVAKISKSTKVQGALTYDAVVDALASIGVENEDGLFLLMGGDGKAEIRKDNDFINSRQGEILYTGQFGSVCGVPCIFSKLVPANTVYATKKDAVKFFVKNAGSVEQDRDIETKDNTVVYERHGVMALVDDTESAIIKFNQTA
jgi:hypothetical protein|nr:MAG TPA_asm: capsid protein [Caudoviricetes sp.]